MRICLGLMLGVLLGGCGEQILLVDPPVEFANPVGGSDAGARDPSLTLGIFSEQFFTPLATGDDLPIVAGFQDGTWVMPAVHAVAMTGAVRADCTVTMVDSGEQVGLLEGAQDRLQPTAEGVAEIVGLPVPIKHVAPNEKAPITDLYERRAVLEMSVVDAIDQRASATVEVVLVQD